MDTEVQNVISADNVVVDTHDSDDAPDLSALIDVAMKAAPNILASLGQSGDLSSLMSMFGSSDTNESEPSTASPLDSLKNMPIRSQSSGKTQLLKALKPYLKPQRAGKIDRAISALETAYAAKSALNLFSLSNGKGN